MEDGTIRQIYFYSVDISEFAVNKLGDRGSLSAKSILTNAQDFVVNVYKGVRKLQEDNPISILPLRNPSKSSVM